MTVFIFLAATAWAWVVTANFGSVVDNGCHGLACTCVCLCCLCLLALCFRRLIEVLVRLFEVLVLWLFYGRLWCLLDILLFGYGNGAAHEYGDGPVIDIVDHLIEKVD